MIDKIRLVSVLLSFAVLALPVAADRPQPPPYYAIHDARVVTGTGVIHDRATVLVADGLIEAVGVDLEIPADAWVIDGEGLSVYPGLIDAMTDIGQSGGEDSDRLPGGPGGSGPEIRGPEDRPGTTPWLAAADLVTIADPRIESWREAGFTSAVSVPEAGFFPGQAALLDLGGEEPRDMVVATPVAQRINFESSARSFPRSLMGGISYVRQTLSDARWDGDGAAGRDRSGYDRALAPLRDALDAGLPFLMPGTHGRDIDRVLAIAREADLEPILYGAHGAYDRVRALAESGASVLVSLDWPEEEKDRDPEAETPFRTLVHRQMAPTTPQELQRAGVPFAFYSAGLSSPAKVFESLRRAIAAGLPEAAALEALTLGAARMFGVDDRLGSVEAGKIANLVLATAAPWAEDVEIEAVFVDGYLYRGEQDEEEHEPPASDVGGTWKVTLETPRGSREMELELKMSEDGKVSGELSSERGTSAIDKGRMSGDLLTFKTTRTMGPRTVVVSYSLIVEGEALSGTASAGPMSMELTGERSAAPADDEAGDQEPAVSTEELTRALAVYQGPVKEYETLAITHARVYTVSGDTLDDATVVVVDGKIRAVGSDVDVPRGAEIVDAAGGSLIPGIIDAHSHIAVDGAVNEGTLAVTSMVSIQDVIDPDDVGIYRALAGGVTTTNVLHGSSNPIGGGNAVLKLRWGGDAAGLRFEGAPPGIKFALGENPKRSRGNRPPGVPRRYPATRMGVMDVIRQALTEAREYRRKWQEYERAGRGASPPRRDLKLERLAEVLAGERLVHSHCYRADEILQLLRLAEEFGFRIATLQHVLEGYKVADEIAAHGAGASTFSDWWGYKVEAYDAIPHNAALMTERGVVVSINSDSGEEMRHLNQEAAKAMKWGGLDEIEALKLVTLNPAKQLGIDSRVGSIEVGKDADLVLFDGHPLSMFSVVQKTFVDGDLYFDLEADRERQALIDDLRGRLEPDDDEEEEDGEEAEEGGESEEPPPERYFTYSCREES
ncbi:MAG: amidohydrolase family protein [Thermoanaerobaculia bacterium]